VPVKGIPNVYLRALGRLINAAYEKGENDYTREEKKKMAILSVKYLLSRKELKNPSAKEAEDTMNFIFMVDNYLGQFTPREFIQVFPVDKTYDGEKYGIKDYFYTMNYLKSVDMDKPIGREGLSEFLWEYVNNKTIFSYSALKMVALGHLQKARGEKDWFEQFAEESNLTLFESFSDGSGQYMQNKKTGEIAKVVPRKRKPKWIRRVK
jgi:hypothetical protein